jgi:hypothetical protein
MKVGPNVTILPRFFLFKMPTNRNIFLRQIVHATGFASTALPAEESLHVNFSQNTPCINLVRKFVN